MEGTRGVNSDTADIAKDNTSELEDRVIETI